MHTEPIDLPVGPAEAAVPPVSRLRPDVVKRAVLTLLFTGIQAWAITFAVLFLPVSGVARLALAAVLAASVLMVLDSWRDVWAAARRAEHRQWSRAAAWQ
jgi:hypothetical protein